MENTKTDDATPTSNAPSARQGCGLLLGGALLAFFGCLGAITSGPIGVGFRGYVMAFFFIVGVVIMMVALVKRFTKTQ
jgi:hypothetical protein